MRTLSEACQTESMPSSLLFLANLTLIAYGLYLQDVESALMRALNMDDMDRAQILRERLQTIDAAIQQIQVHRLMQHMI